MEERLQSFKAFVSIMAYEQEGEDATYQSWTPGRRWQLMNNKAHNFRSFEPVHLETEEMSCQSFLGQECLMERREIPSEWFGNTLIPQQIGTELWNAEDLKGWILHPFFQISNQVVFANVRLTKRSSDPRFYRELSKRLLRMVTTNCVIAENVTIRIYFRDTYDLLGEAWWLNSLPTVTYKNEIMKKSAFEKTSEWLPTQ